MSENTLEFSVNMTCGKCEKKVGESLRKHGNILYVFERVSILDNRRD